jgi:hypothetical protein
VSTKKVKIEFYRIEIQGRQNIEFEQILNRTTNISNENRVKTVHGVPVRLHQSIQDVDNDFWDGEMVRIRMQDLPSKASLDGDLTELELGPEEGIGERTAFLYHPPTQVLLLERTQAGVSASSFARYFEEIAGIEEIEVNPVLNVGAIEKMRQMREISKLEVRIAGLENPGIIMGQEDTSVHEAIKIARQFRAPRINIDVSMGHHRGRFLNKENVIATVMELLRINEIAHTSSSTRSRQRTNMIKITGSLDEDRSRAIVDLINDQRKHEINVTWQGRTIGYEERRDGLRNVWRTYQGEITSLYSSN